MNFFDLRGIFLTQIATEKGKYELEANGNTYPTYSEAALDKMLISYMNENGYDVDKLSAYKKLGTESYNIGQQWYEQTIGKKVEINSVSAYKNMYADIGRIWNNLKFVFEVKVTGADQEFEIGSNYFDYIEYHIDWGDGTEENTVDSSIAHPYAEIGKYIVTVTINKIKDYQSDAFTSPTEIPFYINCNEVTAKCIYANYWAPFVVDVNTAYIATTIKGAEFNTAIAQFASNTPKTIHYGDNTLPYFNPANGISDYITSNAAALEEVYIQTVGTDWGEPDLEYENLKTLKVAPDDLNTFKTAVTAFNNGNTTATLTVLKGKHQDEAYNWATENGHFAAIEKE